MGNIRYDSFETFEKAVKEYIFYYNNERIQAKTKWMLMELSRFSRHKVKLIL